MQHKLIDVGEKDHFRILNIDDGAIAKFLIISEGTDL